MELTELYERQLGAMGAPVNEDDVAELDLGTQKVPLHISDLPVMVPTRDKLREKDQTKRVYFHPLSENVLRGESPVMRKLRELATFKLTAVLSELAIQLMELAADTDRHSKLSPKQIELLAAIPNVDAKTVTALEKVISASSVVDDRRLVSIYLKRGGTFEGEKMSRVAIIDFPIITMADEEEPTLLFGVKMRVKDKAAIISLFEAILEGRDVNGGYNYGTRSPIAPYYCSLIHAFANVAEALNKVTKRFKKILDIGDLVIDLSWVDHAHDLSQYRDLIPTLPMNEGDVSDAGTGGNAGTASTSTLVPAGVPAASGNPQVAPWNTQPDPTIPQSWPRYDAAPAPQQQPDSGSSNTVSWQSVVNGNQQFQRPAPQPVYGQPQQYQNTNPGESQLRQRAQSEAQRSYYQPTYGGGVPSYGGGRSGW